MKIEPVDIAKLKPRETNPNKMTEDQLTALGRSITKYGELQPIIIDHKNNIIDGHQRYQAYKNLGRVQIPAIRLDLKSDADKKLLSQIMNKLKGEHDPILDAAEFKDILKEIELEDVTNLTALTEQNILNLVEQSEKEDAEQVEKLGKLTVTCPKCGHNFERAS